MAVEVQEDSQASTAAGSPFRNASLPARQQGSDTLNAAICPAEDIPFLRDEVAKLGKDAGERVANSAAASGNAMASSGGLGGFGGGSFGGPFSGGGAGAAGFSNLGGGWLGAGLAALALSELSGRGARQPVLLLPAEPLPPDPANPGDPEVNPPVPPTDQNPEEPIVIPEPNSTIIYGSIVVLVSFRRWRRCLVSADL